MFVVIRLSCHLLGPPIVSHNNRWKLFYCVAGKQKPVSEFSVSFIISQNGIFFAVVLLLEPV